MTREEVMMRVVEALLSIPDDPDGATGPRDYGWVWRIAAKYADACPFLAAGAIK